MYNGRPSALSLTGAVGFLDEHTKVPASVNTTTLAYTGNDGPIMSKEPPMRGAIIPLLSVGQVKNSTHSTEIARTYMRESAVAAPQAVPRTDDTYEQFGSITDEIGGLRLPFVANISGVHLGMVLYKGNK
jgi:hypothetical protein